MAGEPHGDEAANFARERLMQREVEVDIANVDRIGAFLGNVYLTAGSGERTDVSSLLLSTEHGYLHESFDSARDRGGARYVSVEREAREVKRGVWLDYVEQVAVGFQVVTAAMRPKSRQQHGTRQTNPARKPEKPRKTDSKCQTIGQRTIVVFKQYGQHALQYQFGGKVHWRIG